MAIKKFFLPLLLPFAILVFSFWLMFHTFSRGPGQELLIATKAWSDFGSHIPLIRSFSRGANWPPEYPLFPGEPIRYHYLFFSTVGWLERLGIRLDYALNLPSALGLASLICLIFIFSFRLFKNLHVALLSCLFFLFNGSFSFLDFFSKHRLSFDSLFDIIHNSVFPSFGPWSGGPITAFWNFNIYTNQRHLGLSFAVLLLLLYFLHFSHRRVYLSGFLLGSLLLLNQAAFIIGLVFYVWYFIVRPQLRFPLFISAFGLIPWAAITVATINFSPQTVFQPGYLINPPLTPTSFFRFWFFNLGLHLFLIPVGFLLAPKSAKILILPALGLFLLANVLRFSSDMINNHKFFNFFLIIGSMYTANLLVRIFKIKFFGPFLTLIFTFMLILGGLIDLFPIINDHYLAVLDTPGNPDVSFFTTLPSNSVVLNSYWFYHPASLAGRPVYMGYSYFTWSYGYDQIRREASALAIYSASSKALACQLSRQANISYVEISNFREQFVRPDLRTWSEFTPAYVSPRTSLVVYSISANCP